MSVECRRISFCIALMLLLVSCDYGVEDLFGRDDKVSSRASALYEAPPPPSVSSYTAAVITDVHFGRKARGGGVHDKCIARFTSYLNDMSVSDRPLFIVCIGDVTEYGEEKHLKEYSNWVKELEGIQNAFGTIKVYTAVGNHDLYNGGYSAWEKLVMPSSLFHFDAGEMSWYFIDSASGAVGRKQYNKIEDAFKKDGKKKIVVSHFPLYAGGKFYFCMQNTTERNMLISLFARNNVCAVLTGHTHERHTDNFGKFTEYNIPSLLDDDEWAVLTVNGGEARVESRK